MLKLLKKDLKEQRKNQNDVWNSVGDLSTNKLKMDLHDFSFSDEPHDDLDLDIEETIRQQMIALEELDVIIEFKILDYSEKGRNSGIRAWVFTRFTRFGK